MQHKGTKATKDEINALSYDVIGAAIEVHKAVGPGLLESAYEECLAHELRLRRFPFERQRALPLTYKGVRLDCGCRLDFVIANRLILESKTVERILPIHQVQLLTYLRLTGIWLGLLMNFNVPVLEQGVRGVVN